MHWIVTRPKNISEVLARVKKVLSSIVDKCDVLLTYYWKAAFAFTNSSTAADEGVEKKQDSDRASNSKRQQ